MTNDITTSKGTSSVVIFAAFVIILAAMSQSQAIVNPLLMGLFLSIISAQPILWLNNKKVPMGVATISILLLELLIFVGLAEVIGSSVASFSNDSAIYEAKLEAMWESTITTLNANGIQLSSDSLSETFNPAKIIGMTAGLLNGLGGLIGSTVTVFFMALFLLLEMNSFSLKTKSISKNNNMSLAFVETIISSIRNYLSIKTISSLLTGVIIWVCLLILGVDYAILWALIAFLFNYIPNIGSIIAAIPAIIFVLVQLGFGGAAWTGIIFLGVNMIVGNVIEPKMMSKGLGLSTYVVFVSLIFWGFILGIAGMFLSVPLTMTIKIILEQNDKTRWIAVMLGSEDDAIAFGK